VPGQIVREYTYAYAAVSPHDGVMDSLILPEVSERTMSIFLHEVSKRHADEFILMVMDGAGWHRAKELHVPENMALIFLPPYSPELNPVEHIWDNIRENWFGNEVFNSIEGVENQLEKALARESAGKSFSRPGKCSGNRERSHRFSMANWYRLERNLVLNSL
jgi:transposase